MSNKIKVTIDALGNPTVEAEGFVGGACKTTTDSLLSSFGGAASVTDKPELHMEAAANEEVYIAI